MPVISVLGRLMQEDYHEFQMKLCLNNKGGKKGGGEAKNVLYTKITLSSPSPTTMNQTGSLLQIHSFKSH